MPERIRPIVNGRQKGNNISITFSYENGIMQTGFKDELFPRIIAIRDIPLWSISDSLKSCTLGYHDIFLAAILGYDSYKDG